MIFKQCVLREEKIKLSIILTCVSIPLLFLILFALLNNENAEMLITFLLICCFPIYITMLLIGVINLEWFCVYEDRIEVKCLFGTKNTVYYNKVLFVEEIKICLTSRGMEKTFYIFNDGRRNNNIINVNSCYNNKRWNLRIYKTPKLESYIINTLNLQVKSV